MVVDVNSTAAVIAVIKREPFVVFFFVCNLKLFKLFTVLVRFSCLYFCILSPACQFVNMAACVHPGVPFFLVNSALKRQCCRPGSRKQYIN